MDAQTQMITRRIANEMDGTWTSTAQIQFTLEPDSAEGRRVVRSVIGDLVRSGRIEHIYCSHGNSMLLVLRLDRHELLRLADEADDS